jgi:cytoskeletal protein CcmA (bactofilin family)
MRVRFLAILLALGGFLLLVAPPAAMAAELSAGPAVTISQGERIDDDLYAAGSTVDIAGEVTRDVFAAASSVVVSGRVGGDATLAAGTIRVDGPIAGSLRVAGGTVEVTAPIGWDLAILGAGSVSVARSATVGHDVAAIGAGTITIDGRVDGDIRGSVGTLIVGGRVNGDIDVDAERIEIRDGAEVRGALRYRAPQPATIAAGARVLGPQEHTPRPAATGREPKTALDRAIDWVMTVLLRLSWAIVAGTLLILLLPQQTSRATDMLRVAPLPTVLWGIACAGRGADRYAPFAGDDHRDSGCTSPVGDLAGCSVFEPSVGGDRAGASVAGSILPGRSSPYLVAQHAGRDDGYPSLPYAAASLRLDVLVESRYRCPRTRNGLDSIFRLGTAGPDQRDQPNADGATAAGTGGATSPDW